MMKRKAAEGTPSQFTAVTFGLGFFNLYWREIYTKKDCNGH